MSILLFYRLGEQAALKFFNLQPGALHTVSLLEARSVLLESEGYQLIRVDWRMEIQSTRISW